MVHAVVITLGDLGRSPRMQYHAVSLAEMEIITRVTLIGYEGENCIPEVVNDHKIEERRLKPILFLEWLNIIPIIHAIIKGILLVNNILKMLWSIPRYDIILIQNPPCLPSLLSTLLYSLFINESIIALDWHNLGCSMYTHKYSSSSHPVVLLSKLMEWFLGSMCHYHVCVSDTLNEWLQNNFMLPKYQPMPLEMLDYKIDTNDDGGIKTLYDRPAALFSPTLSDCTNRHNLLKKLMYTDTELFPKILNIKPFSGESHSPHGRQSSGDAGIAYSPYRKPLLNTPAGALGLSVNSIDEDENNDNNNNSNNNNSSSSSNDNQVASLPLNKDEDEDDDFYRKSSMYGNRNRKNKNNNNNDNDKDTLSSSTSKSVVLASKTCQTSIHGTFRDDAAMLIISSTSYTEEEDFGLLLHSLVALDRALIDIDGIGPQGCIPPRVVIVITGKGPLKDLYRKRFERLEQETLSRVAIRMPWLETNDYAIMLALASLGISLHTSTSGLDLPMKILDMFGSGVPVMAVAFPALSELINEKNGVLFAACKSQRNFTPSSVVNHDNNNNINSNSSSSNSSKQPSIVLDSLENLLPDLVCDYLKYQYNRSFNTPTTNQIPPLMKLQRFVQYHAMDDSNRWRANWDEVMKPLVLNMIAERVKGPSYWLGLFRFIVTMAILIPSMFLIVWKFKLLFGKDFSLTNMWKNGLSSSSSSSRSIKFLMD